MTRLLLISTFALVTSYLCSATGQSQCTTPNGKIGKCVSIFSCSSLLKLLMDPQSAEVDFLRSSFCQFAGSTPWVCCPADTCTTPDGDRGTCIGIYSCPHITNMLKWNPSQAAIQYVQKSRCGSLEQQNVCCGPQPNTALTTSTLAGEGSRQKCHLTASPPVPSSGCCGVDASGSGNRIVGGDATAVDEYPWLAIIEYVKGNRMKLLCGGALISGQYVLTAGHCLVGPVLSSGAPVNVRLGEYDTYNTGPDCVEVEGGGQDCNDGALIVRIENAIAHPYYNPNSELRRNDIGLIKLARIVEFTDFIRPICLPTVDFTSASPANVDLYAAGWGAVSNAQTSSNIKMKVSLPYMSYQDCQLSYNVARRQVPLWDGQICAGGVRGKDSCRGDSGGPLMRENGGLFELVGIVSFGSTPCGMENVAGVYTKVFHYLPWIRSQIVA